MKLKTQKIRIFLFSLQLKIIASCLISATFNKASARREKANNNKYELALDKLLSIRGVE